LNRHLACESSSFLHSKPHFFLRSLLLPGLVSGQGKILT
jgi:hypothetical protein